FADVQNAYFAPLVPDLIAIFGPSAQYYFDLYMDMNFYYAYFDTSEDQYFGENGDKTQLIKKTQKNLERFWNMPNEVRINGQHTATLNDREKLADLWEMIGANVHSREDAYELADMFLEINTLS